MINNNATIFIVDDEPLLSEMLADYLKDQYSGFNIQSFPTGEACLQSLHLQPNIVVLDYYLNSKEKDAANGIDILKEIKEAKPETEVVMISSQDKIAPPGQGTANAVEGFAPHQHRLSQRQGFKALQILRQTPG